MSVNSRRLRELIDNMLSERASNHDILTSKSAPPSWQKTAPHLLPGRLVTAEIASSRQLLKKLNAEAAKLPWLRPLWHSSDELAIGGNSADRLPDRSSSAEYVTGLLEAYFSIQLGGDVLNNFRDKWGRKRSEELEGRVQRLLPALNEERNRLFQAAQNWTARDQKREIRETHRYLAKLPKEKRNLLYMSTDLLPEKASQIFARWGLTFAATAASTFALDGIATAAGGAGVAIDALLSHRIESLHTAYLLAGFTLTYGFWGIGMNENLKANWEALEQEGVSTNAPSKMLHDFAKSKEWSEKSQKVAAGAGYVGTEIAKEAPYYIGAFGAATLIPGLSTKDAIIFLGFTNLAAGCYEGALAIGTKRVLNYRARQAEKA